MRGLWIVAAVILAAFGGITIENDRYAFEGSNSTYNENARSIVSQFLLAISTESIVQLQRLENSSSNLTVNVGTINTQTTALDSEILPRFVSLVRLVEDLNNTGVVWLFGGLTHLGPTNRVHMISLMLPNENATGRNVQYYIQTFSAAPGCFWPLPRYAHAISAMPGGGFAIYGGINALGVELNDSYIFDPVTTTFSTLYSFGPSPALPSLAGHSLTYVSHLKALFLIGGYSSLTGFNKGIFLFDWFKHSWSFVMPSAPVPQIVNHDAVYVEATKLIFLVGGTQFFASQLISSPETMWVYNITTMSWMWLSASERTSKLKVGYYDLIITALIGNESLVPITGTGSGSYGKQFLHFTLNSNLSALGKNISAAGQGLLLGYLSLLHNNNLLIFAIESSFDIDSLQFLKLLVLPDVCSPFDQPPLCLDVVGCPLCSNGPTQISYGLAGCIKPSVDISVSSSRNCSPKKTCVECLAVNLCNSENCIWNNVGNICTEVGYASAVADTVSSIGRCEELRCSYYDCLSCLSSTVQPTCSWYISGLNETKGNGRCRIYDPVDQSPPILNSNPLPLSTNLQCGSRCADFLSCDSCIKGTGFAEDNCFWSAEFSRCFSSVGLLLFCPSADFCSGSQSCVSPCENFTSCGGCIASSACGWCSFQSSLDDESGKGFCLAGRNTFRRPPFCNSNDFVLVNSTIVLSYFNLSIDWPSLTSPVVSWNTLNCPPENACITNRSLCDPKREVCVPTLGGYNCVCADGYRLTSNSTTAPHCVPLCSLDCIHGHCANFNQCHCDFGYTGEFCNLTCNCSGHSNCHSDDLNLCLECMNHTTGSSCENCISAYIPFGGRCLSCSEYCNRLSDTCTVTTQIVTSLGSSKAFSSLPSKLPNVVCEYCQNNTAGTRCDLCKAGYFRLNGSCVRCRCGPNSFANVCGDDGTNCDCSNNTVSPTCDQNPGVPCYDQQCTRCKDGFFGYPSRDSLALPCYLTVGTVNSPRCFDASSSGLCYQNGDPTTLSRSSLCFFFVQPVFNNVDLSVAVDIGSGIDLYFGLENEFAVNPSAEASTIKIVMGFQQSVFQTANSSRPLSSDTSSNVFNLNATAHFLQTGRLTEYISLSSSSNVIIVQSLAAGSRLMLRLSSAILSVQEMRLFVVVRGTSASAVRGAIYYSQSQLRMDLFIFFSVFFSCFFLVMVLVGFIWRLYRSVLSRRVRRLQNLEMENLASRPSAKLHICLSSRDTVAMRWNDLHFPVQNNNLCSLSTAGGTSDVSKLSPHHYTNDILSLPFCLQPLRKGHVGVASFIVQLPGGHESPCALAIGSTLITLSSTQKRSSSRSELVSTKNSKQSRVIFPLLHPKTRPGPNPS